MIQQTQEILSGIKTVLHPYVSLNQNS